jgi:hypothetical protein
MSAGGLVKKLDLMGSMRYGMIIVYPQLTRKKAAHVFYENAFLVHPGSPFHLHVSLQWTLACWGNGIKKLHYCKGNGQGW